MPQTFSSIVIDARPAGPHGPWADRLLHGQTILSWHVRLANQITGHPPQILDHRASRLQPPDDPQVLLLRTDRLYNAKKLHKAYRNGTNPERAVIWRLDQAHDLDRAADELNRRTSYQPLGRFWAWPLARRLAESLKSTPVRPNMLTLAATAAMLGAAACLPLGTGWQLQLVTASLLAFGLVLDTADGHLARIQGTTSEFGRWLDAVLDELCDLVLHGAVAWACYSSTGHPAWLIVGMAYIVSKYLFQTAMLEDRPDLRKDNGAQPSNSSPASPTGLRKLVHLLGHADIRWHSWIIFAVIGRLDLMLLFGVAYFAARVAAMVSRKAVAHA